MFLNQFNLQIYKKPNELFTFSCIHTTEEVMCDTNKTYLLKVSHETVMWDVFSHSINADFILFLVKLENINPNHVDKLENNYTLKIIGK